MYSSDKIVYDQRIVKVIYLGNSNFKLFKGYNFSKENFRKIDRPIRSSLNP